MSNLGLQAAMIWSGRRAHHDVTVPICFNTALESGQFGISEQLGPATQVELGLRLLRRQFDCQHTHDGTIEPEGCSKVDSRVYRADLSSARAALRMNPRP